MADSARTSVCTALGVW